VILLINPPVTKPAEPPGGIAQLAGALKAAHSPDYLIWDAALEGAFALLNSPLQVSESDRWTKRALSHRESHIKTLRTLLTYGQPARYGRAVRDLNRLLERQAKPYGVQLGLTDYQDPRRSPVSSRDLIAMAEHPEENPFYPYFVEELSRICTRHDPTIIGLSLNYLSQALCTFALLGVIKQLGSQARIVIGGSLITSWRRYLTSSDPFSGLVDAFVFGPGEEALLRLGGAGEIVEDALPRYDNFPSHRYLSPLPIAPLALSRGCYYGRCRFCPERAEGIPYEALNCDTMEKRLEKLATTYHPGLFHFLDYALSPRILRALMHLSPSIPWYGFARITEELADPEFCEQLKESGCVMLKLGVESGAQSVLDAMEKGINVSMISRVLRTLARVGIATYIYVLLGTPEEGHAEAEETQHFLRDHALFITFMNVALFNLPVGSRPDLQCRPFYGGDLALYEDFVHPRGWSRLKVRTFLSRSFTRDPTIREILLRTPPLFSSNHAPFVVYPRERVAK